MGKLVDDLPSHARAASVEVAPLDFIASLLAALVTWWHEAAHEISSVAPPGAAVGGLLVAHQVTRDALPDDAVLQTPVGDEASDEDAVIDVRDVIASLGGHRPGRGAGQPGKPDGQ
jgi:hypothetical protein